MTYDQHQNVRPRLRGSDELPARAGARGVHRLPSHASAGATCSKNCTRSSTSVHPRVRGSDATCDVHERGVHRSIHTRVGATSDASGRSRSVRARSTARRVGAVTARRPEQRVRYGPSTRAWERHGRQEDDELPFGSIHARVGATPFAHAATRGGCGPSTRASGVTWLRSEWRPGFRSIHARVGATDNGPCSQGECAVHPRVRGSDERRPPLTRPAGPSTRAWERLERKPQRLI